MNRITLIGRISNEPEFKAGTTDGRRWYLAKFDIAVPRHKGGRNVKKQEIVDFFHIQAAGAYAGAIKDYGTKGMKILVTGEMHNNSYRNQKGFTIKSDLVLPDYIEFVEAPHILKQYIESKEGQKFLAEYCDQNDAVNTDAPEVADFDVDSSELPFG